MKRLIALFLIGALAAPTAGCFTTTVITDQGYNPSKSVADYEAGWQTFALFGLIPISSEIELNQICPNGGAGIVQTEMPFLQGLISHILGLTLVSFRTARVYCKGATGNLEIDVDAQGRVLAVRPTGG